jgi:hypothetical protein
MQEEIFGPILPVMPVKSADEVRISKEIVFKIITRFCWQALEIMQMHDSPLALYIFGKNRTVIDK